MLLWVALDASEAVATTAFMVERSHVIHSKTATTSPSSPSSSEHLVIEHLWLTGGGLTKYLLLDSPKVTVKACQTLFPSLRDAVKADHLYVGATDTCILVGLL